MTIKSDSMTIATPGGERLTSPRGPVKPSRQGDVFNSTVTSSTSSKTVVGRGPTPRLSPPPPLLAMVDSGDLVVPMGTTES